MSDFETSQDTRMLLVDPVEEMRLRTWARVNYQPRDERGSGLHPIVLDEMSRKDTESHAS